MNIQKYIKQGLIVFKKAPLELFLGVCAFIWYMLSEQADLFIIRKFWETFLWGEIFIYSCNYWSRTKIIHTILYSVSPLLFGGLVCIDQVFFIDLVSLNSTLIFTTLLFSYNWFCDNRKYATNALNIGSSVAIASILSLSVFLIIIGTYYSITSIFELKSNHHFYEYIGALCYFIILPFFFLFFRLQQKGHHEVIAISKSHPISIFINYILSPAIIIYTAILYIYLFQIIIQWTLPKGSLAMMVFALNISVLVAELIRSTLPSKILLINRYFRYFHVLVIPLLFLFWIAVYQRISYYSFTENRIYLILAGIAMTWFVFSHYHKQTYKFLYLAIVTASLFILTTFIPGITAKEIADKLYQPTEHSETTSTKNYINITLYPKGEISIQGMNKFIPYSTDNYQVKDSVISVSYKDEKFNINIQKHLEQQLKEHHINIKGNIDLNRRYVSKDIFHKNFGRIEISSDTIIILDYIELHFPNSTKDDYEIRSVKVQSILTK